MMLFASVANINSPNVDRNIDDSLIIDIGNGNKQAFTILYKLSKNSIYAYALSILKNPDDAEDAMQDTYLKIRAAAHLYNAKGKPMAWILTITRNICLMKLRQKKNISPYVLEEIPPELDLNQIEDLEDRIVIKAALQILSDEEFQIIILHAVSGFKHREISSFLQLPISTVLSKYNRALKKLKSELEGKI